MPNLLSKRSVFCSIFPPSSRISICLFATIKYHLRFNENRKFHDLENINFQLSSDANKIDKKLSGLNWITYEFKNDPDEEIKMINQIQSYLRNDSRNKMLITNYSFFATILNEKTFSPSRVYAGDGTTNPIKGNKYVPKYKKLMIDLIKKNNISVIYITVPLDDSNIYDFMRFGLTWWPIENVAFKMDYGTKTKKSDSDNPVNQFNLGIGYSF